MSTSGQRDPTPSERGSRQSTTAEAKDGIKIAKPDLYYGDRDKLEEWLVQMQLYFSFNRDAIRQGKQPLFAMTYMRGRAQRWSAPFLKRYMEDPNDESNASIKL